MILWSRIGKPPKLASGKYRKRKKRKFTYQEPPSCDAEFNKHFEEATKTESTNKRKKQSLSWKLDLTLRKKREESSKKENDPEQRQGTKYHNCDICKLLINEVYLKYNLCNKYDHSVYNHPSSSITKQFTDQASVCSNCIHDKNPSFFPFVAGKAIHVIKISEIFIK